MALQLTNVSDRFRAWPVQHVEAETAGQFVQCYDSEVAGGIPPVSLRCERKITR
jgi:hypothetical protein